VLVSAGGEWRPVLQRFADVACSKTPFGEHLNVEMAGWDVCLMRGGWGKISAAASAQYALDVLQPDVLVNLGTCGGFEGCVKEGEILLVDETMVYDIFERMTDPQTALDAYTTRLDLGWLHEPFPQTVRRGRMLSADRDIDPADIPWLRQQFAGIAADWESASIAWVSFAWRRSSRKRTPKARVWSSADIASPAGSKVNPTPRAAKGSNEDLLQRRMMRKPTRLAGLVHCTALAKARQPCCGSGPPAESTA